MLEALVVAMATAGLFALARVVRDNERFKIDPRLVVSVRAERDDDLPCPWCYAPTDEKDRRCGECGVAFG
ncbi:MAG: hypothetical protein ACRDU9_00835 [Acidimicrobiia bacterium]